MRWSQELQPSGVGRRYGHPEFVLSGSIDGHMRAYAAADGRVLWDFDTERAFTTTNGVAASGGSIDAAGPTVAGGMIFFGSG